MTNKKGACDIISPWQRIQNMTNNALFPSSLAWCLLTVLRLSKFIVEGQKNSTMRIILVVVFGYLAILFLFPFLSWAIAITPQACNIPFIVEEITPKKVRV